MKGKKLIAAVVALVLVIAAAYFAYSRLSADNAPAQIQENKQNAESVEQDGENKLAAAPDFTVYDADGNSVSLSDFRGKPVVLNFWASWCGYCVAEMPSFDKLNTELGGEVHFLMVNVTDGSSETIDSAKEFISSGEYAFPVYYDTDLGAAMAYGAFSLPQTYFIDADGNLVAGARGALSESTLRQGVDMIME